MNEPNSNSATTTATEPKASQQALPNPTLVASSEGTQQAPIATPAVTPGETKPATEASPSTADAAYDLTPSDGGVIDVGVVKGFAAAAHRQGIAKDAAQKILSELEPTIAARAQENTKRMHDEWRAQSNSDPRFGGPEKAAAIDARIDRAIEKLGTPKLRELLDNSRLREQPEFRAFLLAAGDSVSDERTVVTGKPAADAPKRVNGMMTNREAAARMPYQY